MDDDEEERDWKFTTGIAAVHEDVGMEVPIWLR